MDYEKVRAKVKGILVVMTTPFKDNYELDIEGVKKHTRFLIEKGLVSGAGVLVPTGSTGECPMLRENERKEVLKAIVEAANNEVPVFCGCNHTDTRVVIELAQYAEKIGSDGVMISPPYYWCPTEDVVLNHYTSICNEIDIGVMVYNNWFASQLDMTIETLEKLAEIPNIVAIKENSCRIEKWDVLCLKLGDKVNIVTGNGDVHEPYTSLMGSNGIISGLANFIPEKYLEIYKAITDGDFMKARKLHHEEILPLAFSYTSDDSSRYIAFLKEYMNLMGIPAGPARLPIVPLNSTEKEEIKKIAIEYKLI